MSLTGQEKLETAPTDKRFPTTNQAKHCYMYAARAEPRLPCMHYLAPARVGRYYNSWHQCKYDHSDEEPQCQKLRQWTYSMCPTTWVRSTNPLPSGGSRRPPFRSTPASTLLAILVLSLIHI